MADRGMRVEAVAAAGGATSRAALCIGVSRYASSPLPNSAHDAADVAAALREIGFQAALLLEPSLKQILDALEAFVAELQPGGTAVFFFAGVPRSLMPRSQHATRSYATAPMPRQATARRRTTAATT